MKLTDKQKNNIGKLVIFTGVAVGGVFAVRAIVDAIKEGNKGGATPDSPNASVMKEKIKSLQTLVGAYPDGIVGKNTKIALAKMGLDQNVTSANIDSLITQAQSKAAATAVITARLTLAKKYFDMVKNQGYKYIKMKSAYTVSKYKYDSVTKKMISLGETITLSSDYAYNIGQFSYNAEGFIYFSWPYGAAPGINQSVGQISPWAFNIYTEAEAKKLNFKLA